MENGGFLDARMDELDLSEQLPHLHGLLGLRRDFSPQQYPATRPRATEYSGPA
jgi:hypothetical protein